MCVVMANMMEVEANSLDFKDFLKQTDFTLYYAGFCFKTILSAILTKLSMLTKPFTLLTYNFKIFKQYTSYFH